MAQRDQDRYRKDMSSYKSSSESLLPLHDLSSIVSDEDNI